MKDTLLCAARELVRRRGRTLVGVLGYALAVAAVVVLVAALVHARRAAGEILTNTGTHFIAFAPASAAACPGCVIRTAPDAAEGFEANGIATGLVPTGLVARIRALATVLDASPYLRFRLKDPPTGQTFTIGGYDPASETSVGTTCCAATDVVAGRFLRPDEAGAVMLEEAYARLKGLAPGDRVQVAGEAMEVVGVVNPGIRPAKADIYMHLDDARRAVGRRLGADAPGDAVNVVLVEVARAPVQDEAIASVKALMPGLLVSSYACYKPAAAVMGINERAVVLLAALIGAGAVVVAMKTQLAAVVERRRDIAVLKAIGWTDRSVVLQVLAESVLVALAGGAIGCLAAVALLVLVPMETLSGIPAAGGAAVSADVLAWALGLALAGGALAGIVPAASAARRRPAEALRRL